MIYKIQKMTKETYEAKEHFQDNLFVVYQAVVGLAFFAPFLGLILMKAKFKRESKEVSKFLK